MVELVIGLCGLGTSLFGYLKFRVALKDANPHQRARIIRAMKSDIQIGPFRRSTKDLRDLGTLESLPGQEAIESVDQESDN